MPTWNAGGIVSNDNATADFYSVEPRSGPQLNVFQQTLTAADTGQQNNTITINADDARIHSVSIDLDEGEDLQEYYADIVRRFERNHPEYFTAQRWNVSPDVSFRLNKHEIKELIREVLEEEGIILNKPQKAIEAEEVDELFEQRGINDES